MVKTFELGFFYRLQPPCSFRVWSETLIFLPSHYKTWIIKKYRWIDITGAVGIMLLNKQLLVTAHICVFGRSNIWACFQVYFCRIIQNMYENGNKYKIFQIKNLSDAPSPFLYFCSNFPVVFNPTLWEMNSFLINSYDTFCFYCTY